jgi:hypothetical protein
MHAMKTYGGEDSWLHSFLTSALDGDKLSASLTGRFIPVKRSRHTLNRRLVGPRDYIDFWERKNILSLPGFEPLIGVDFLNFTFLSPSVVKENHLNGFIK